jgi:hypothetical protein
VDEPDSTPTADDQSVNPDDWVTIPKAVFAALVTSSDIQKESNRLAWRFAKIMTVLFVLAFSLLAYKVLWSDPHAREAASRERQTQSDQIGDVKTVVDVVRNYTSPEAQADRDKAFAGAVIALDCKNRESLQVLADALAERGTAARVTLTCSPP